MMGRIDAMREMDQADPPPFDHRSRALGLPKKPMVSIGSGQ